MLDVHLMDEMENNRKQYFCAMSSYTLMLCMFVSAAACAPTNRMLNKTSPGTVSFFTDHLYANFSSTKITSPTRINAKMQK